MAKIRQGRRILAAQGIEVEILVVRLGGQQDWSGKPGFRRFEKAPEMRPKKTDKNSYAFILPNNQPTQEPAYAGEASSDL
jgi:hypothetical protein